MNKNKLKIKNIIKKFKENENFHKFIIIFLTGTFLFFLIYGFEAFKIFPQPFNDNDYLLYQASYYAFINSGFDLPIFYTDKLFIEREANLIFGDYIPIYSLSLKLINNIFGIKILDPFMFWIYLNTLLFFYFSFKIFSLSSKLSFYECILGAAIISTLPLSPYKFLFHSGESSHFVLSAGIYFYFKSKENTNYLYFLAILTSLTLWIHFYLFAILCGILFISVFTHINKFHIIFKTSFIFLIFSLVIFYLSFQSINSFLNSLESEIVTSFNPRWSAEFNSFFCSYNNPTFLNEFLKCYEPFTTRDIESYAYLGLGIIIFIPIVFLKIEFNKALIKNYKSITILSLFYLLFSFGNRIKIAHKQVYEYGFTSIHLKLIEIFRAHGRFIYLFYYLLAFLIIYNLFLISREKKTKVFVITIFLLIQSGDLARQYLGTDLNLFRVQYAENEILSTAQKSKLNLNYRLFIYPPDNCDEDYDMYLFAKEFLKFGGSISSSRIRGGNNYINCNNININSSLLNYQPKHFVITNSAFLQFREIIESNYICEIMSGEYKNDYIHYCQT